MVPWQILADASVRRKSMLCILTFKPPLWLQRLEWALCKPWLGLFGCARERVRPYERGEVAPSKVKAGRQPGSTRLLVCS